MSTPIQLATVRRKEPAEPPRDSHQSALSTPLSNAGEEVNRQSLGDGSIIKVFFYFVGNPPPHPAYPGTCTYARPSRPDNADPCNCQLSPVIGRIVDGQ